MANDNPFADPWTVDCVVEIIDTPDGPRVTFRQLAGAYLVPDRLVARVAALAGGGPVAVRTEGEWLADLDESGSPPGGAPA